MPVSDAALVPVAVPRAPARRRLPSTAIALCVLLALLPALGGGYWIFTLGVCFANAIAILSVSFMVRYGGEVSIGHGVFAAVGAYTVALAEKYLGLSILASLPLAALAGATLGIVFAYPSRAISGIYLAVTTLALALALPEVLLYFSSITGGYEGLYVKREALPGVALSMQRYYLPLAGLIAVALLLHHFRRSRQAMALLLI
ncbi:MAG: branched-chain amino acid ABC transporter permease, partial [Comamonadaceae bacterium]